MKKTIIVLASLAVLVACGGGGDTKDGETKKDETATTKDITADPDYQKGLEVVSKSDCMTCHLINEKNIGPAWVDVANKYAGQDTAVAYLAKKNN